MTQLIGSTRHANVPSKLFAGVTLWYGSSGEGIIRPFSSSMQYLHSIHKIYCTDLFYHTFGNTLINVANFISNRTNMLHVIRIKAYPDEKLLKRLVKRKGPVEFV